MEEKSKVKKIIEEEIKTFLEDFKFDNSQKTFQPNPSMIANCKRAIKAITSNDLTSDGGNEGSGKDKAQSIINNEPITHSMLKRMKAFFDNNSSEYQSDLARGKTLLDSAMVQSWNLWGGDAAKEMSNREIDYTQKDNQKRKDLKTSFSPTKTSTLMSTTNTRIKK